MLLISWSTRNLETMYEFGLHWFDQTTNKQNISDTAKYFQFRFLIEVLDLKQAFYYLKN